MAKKQQSAMARSIPAQVGASTLASLESQTTSEAAQAQAAVALRVGKQITGQYLFDRFVADSKADVTKMDIVRTAASAVDVLTFKKAVADMVGIAAAKVKQAKEADPSSPAEVAAYEARLKTAQNHQTVLRIGYGAIRFAPEQMTALGFDETTGYQLVRVIGLKALSEAGLKWDGSKAVTDPKAKAEQANSKAEAKALAQVMADNPRNSGESLPSYLERVGGAVDNRVKANREESEAKMIKDLAVRVRTQCGGLLDEVLQAILAGEGQPELDPKAAQEAAPAATKH